MKKDTHPQYYADAKVVCACGNNFTVGSTQKEHHVEICSMCHPFYTGKQKLVDSARRVEKFKERLAKKDSTAASRKGKKVKRAKKREAEKTKEHKAKKSEKEEKADDKKK